MSGLKGTHELSNMNCKGTIRTSQSQILNRVDQVTILRRVQKVANKGVLQACTHSWNYGAYGRDVDQNSKKTPQDKKKKVKKAKILDLKFRTRRGDKW